MESKTMFCPNCGKKILRNSNYCPYCGNKIDFSFQNSVVASSENKQLNLKKDESANQVKQVEIPKKENSKNQGSNDRSAYSKNKADDLLTGSQVDFGSDSVNSLKEQSSNLEKAHANSSETNDSKQSPSATKSKEADLTKNGASPQESKAEANEGQAESSPTQSAGSEKAQANPSKSEEPQQSSSDRQHLNSDSHNGSKTVSLAQRDEKAKNIEPEDVKENEATSASAKHLESTRNNQGISIQFTNNAFQNIFRWLAANIYVTVIAVLALFVVFSFSTLFGWIGAIGCFVAVFLVANNSRVGKTNIESSIRDKVKSNDHES